MGNTISKCKPEEDSKVMCLDDWNDEQWLHLGRHAGAQYSATKHAAMGNSKSKPEEDSKEEPPKEEPCRHEAEIQLGEERIKRLSRYESSLMDQMEKIKEKTVELETFFEEFGSNHPDNFVTAMANDLNDECWDDYSDQETKLIVCLNDQNMWHRRLARARDHAKQKNCRCVKTEMPE